jgi:glycosyltransferase involved in cell wall biosynthesis
MGIRGVPAEYGGFETFAARLAPYLVARGWKVTVYCQEDARRPCWESEWKGVRRVHIGVGSDSALNTVRFDWACVSHALDDRPSMVLTLGYNTALFGMRLRAAGIPNVINMDGIEWSRSKWGPLARAWLYLNDWAGCLVGNHLLADHPSIARHLATRVGTTKISAIPYGTDQVSGSDPALLDGLGLVPGSYATVVARPEPENSLLEIVQAFSAHPRGIKLVVLGRFAPDKVRYHRQVMQAASDEVMFPGAIYDAPLLQALREHCVLYVHGHQVGGTNPSLLEAMGAGNAVLAHDNRFNRWVARAGACYFRDMDSCRDALDALLPDAQTRDTLAQANRRRAAKAFAWPLVLQQYQATLNAVHARSTGLAGAPLPTAAGRMHPD